MPAWWSILVIVALVGFAGGLYLRARGDRTDTRRADHERTGEGPARDIRQARETDRLAHLTEEDRGWERASLERNREPRAGPGAAGGE